MRWIRSERPSSYWDVVGRHFPLALVTGIVLLAATFVPLHRLPMIPCTFLRYTGYPCPFCGMTRAFAAMGHGDHHTALAQSPLAILLYVGAWGVFLWNAIGLASGRRLYLSGQTRPVAARHWIMAGAVLLALNWIYRLAMGLR